MPPKEIPDIAYDIYKHRHHRINGPSDPPLPENAHASNLQGQEYLMERNPNRQNTIGFRGPRLSLDPLPEEPKPKEEYDPYLPSYRRTSLNNRPQLPPTPEIEKDQSVWLKSEQYQQFLERTPDAEPDWNPTIWIEPEPRYQMSTDNKLEWYYEHINDERLNHHDRLDLLKLFNTSGTELELNKINSSQKQRRFRNLAGFLRKDIDGITALLEREKSDIMQGDLKKMKSHLVQIQDMVKSNETQLNDLKNTEANYKKAINEAERRITRNNFLDLQLEPKGQIEEFIFLR